MSNWTYKGSDGTRRFYEKAPDKDGYVAKLTMTGSAGTRTYKPAATDGNFNKVIEDLIWNNRHFFFAILGVFLRGWLGSIHSLGNLFTGRTSNKVRKSPMRIIVTIVIGVASIFFAGAVLIFLKVILFGV